MKKIFFMLTGYEFFMKIMCRQEREEAERLNKLAEERESRIQLIENEAKENAVRRPTLEDSIEQFESKINNIWFK